LSWRRRSAFDDGDRAESHGGRGDYRIEHNTEHRIEGARRNGNSDRVVDEGEEQVLLDVAHRGSAEPPRARDTSQIPLDQGDPRALHGHIGAGSHGDADVGLGQRPGTATSVPLDRLHTIPAFHLLHTFDLMSGAPATTSSIPASRPLSPWSGYAVSITIRIPPRANREARRTWWS
jgi:hypothetical protein